MSKVTVTQDVEHQKYFKSIGLSESALRALVGSRNQTKGDSERYHSFLDGQKKQLEQYKVVLRAIKKRLREKTAEERTNKHADVDKVIAHVDTELLLLKNLRKRKAHTASAAYVIDCLLQAKGIKPREYHGAMIMFYLGWDSDKPAMGDKSRKSGSPQERFRANRQTGKKKFGTNVTPSLVKVAYAQLIDQKGIMFDDREANVD